MTEQNIDSILTPPNSVHSEQAVLGALLSNSNNIYLIETPLEENDFYNHANRQIFRVINKLCSEDKPADVLTVFDALRSEALDVECGGIEYLNRLTESNSSAANINEYAKIIQDKSLRRKIINTLNDLLSLSTTPSASDATSLLERTQAKMMEIESADQKRGADLQTSGDLIDELANEMLEKQKNPFSNMGLIGVGSGITVLDDEIKGFRPGQLIVLAARPSVGKTAMGLQMIRNVALVHKKPVVVFSLEMTALDLIRRIASSICRIDSKAMDSGYLSEEEWKNFYKATKDLKEAQIFVNETGSLTLHGIKSLCRKLTNRVGQLGLIMIDYLQLIDTTELGGASEATRALALGEVSRGLKILSKELNVPILLLSQLNRQVDQRPSHIPVLSDLRDSGAIEQDADIVIMLRRLGLYNSVEDPALTDIYLVKHRGGQTGEYQVEFNGAYQTFEEINRWDD